MCICVRGSALNRYSDEESKLVPRNLSDNVISIIDEDAFEGVDRLENLRLDSNNIHRLTLSSVPTSLERLELQDNLLDLMPDFPDDFEVSRLVHLYVLVSWRWSLFDRTNALDAQMCRNLSCNYLWSISTNDALTPYTGLVTLYVYLHSCCFSPWLIRLMCVTTMDAGI